MAIRFFPRKARAVCAFNLGLPLAILGLTVVYGAENRAVRAASRDTDTCLRYVHPTVREPFPDLVNLSVPAELKDPRLLFALLELHRATRHAAFLEQADAIGQNLLKQRVLNGWFVPSQRHIFCRVANDKSQAVLHLAAALAGRPDAIPAFTGAQPFFHAEYGKSTGRVYDSADIYGKTR